ncbi:TPA: TetR/AcrR family transcriptional regulator [Streptococcus suis]|uniref:TetR/AcrR family transcriptional regulator n=2 Tax=Streptococcus TaxID=1301 RepID=A0A7X6N1F7_9STRE|nr:MULTISPECIES: TetR/AcrR family transcriptional regulator [Bacillota]NKZ21193.1 TetR/AcrR family transcriptional regulator [Streptococcus ovuberis]MDY2794083.1 TetR/AcrR family transcriptional regulator [Peptostreptococcus porci]NQG64916.1 TetR/AcrR family transcriptional regulator [Streptococcus suis]NQG66494.1 TetR/AcrR family transcriptional regulator [Streptococcus suis]CYV40871.1 transcriptional regulator [Streptococcus suis]
MTDLTGYELTHKKILDSGKATFMKDGYERANLRKICKNAGVTTGAFYRHFEDKEDLFVALVESLANEILELYSKFETESFQSLDRNKFMDLADINLVGVMETALYVFEKKDIFELLIYKSYGTKYADFADKLIKFEDENQKKVFQILAEKKQMTEIPETAVHLLNHAYINALSEIIIHSKTIDEVKENSKIVVKFFNDGWKNLLGF